MKEFLVVYDVVGFDSEELAKQQAEVFNKHFAEYMAASGAHRIRFKVLTLRNGRRVDG